MTRKKKAGKSRDKPKTPPPSAKTDAAGRKRRPRWRTWAARLLAAVLAPMLLLTAVELGLRLFGYGYDTSYFIKAEDGESYRSNPKFGWRFFGAELSRSPIPTVVEAVKPENTYRVFVFGGSAAQGVPDPAFSFGRILQAMLRDRFPDTHFEVINTAMVAVNSHAVLPIVKECRGFGGDLFIVYLGNNEVVGPYGAGTVFDGPLTSTRLVRASIYVRSTRLGQLIGDAARAFAGDDPEARKQWGGMRMFLDHRVAAGDPRLQVVYDNFRANLDDVCAAAAGAGVPLILSTVLTNLKDCPPFHSVHRPGLSDDETARWDKTYRRAITLEQSGKHADAVRSYEAAAEIDDQFAELHFRLGSCRLALGQFDLARRHFVRARDLDDLRFRADTRINQIIRQAAGDHGSQGVYLVDPEGAFRTERHTPHGILGSELLYEHVHLNFQGNYLVAAAMFRKIATLLPAEIRQHAQQQIEPPPVEPPPVERCRELTLYTQFNRLFDAAKIAQITADPPFPEVLGRRSAAEAMRLEAELTPELLKDIAEDYRQALERRPDDLLLRNVFAALQSVRKEHASAAEQYEALIGRYPDAGQWHRGLGGALLGQGKAAEAVARFRFVLEMNPNDFESQIALASALAETGDPQQAIREYGKALAMLPNHARTHFQLGKLLLQRDRLEQAEEHLAAAVDADPEASRFHFFFGLALAKQEKLERAVEQYDREVSLFPKDPFPRLELARILLTRGQAEQARAHLAAAIQSAPKIPQAHFLLGQIFENRRQLDQAVREYETELTIQPKHSGAHFRLGRLLLGSNNPAEAQPHFAAAIQIEPDVSDFHHQLARSLLATGKKQRAIGSFRRAIELDAKSISALNDLAWLYATDPNPQLRNGSQAAELAGRASKLSGGADPTILDTLAAAYAEAGQLDQAVRTARKAISLAEQANHAAFAQTLRGRLQLYLAGKPFHEPSP